MFRGGSNKFYYENIILVITCVVTQNYKQIKLRNLYCHAYHRSAGLNRRRCFEERWSRWLDRNQTVSWRSASGDLGLSYLTHRPRSAGFRRFYSARRSAKSVVCLLSARCLRRLSGLPWPSRRFDEYHGQLQTRLTRSGWERRWDWLFRRCKGHCGWRWWDSSCPSNASGPIQRLLTRWTTRERPVRRWVRWWKNRSL